MHLRLPSATSSTWAIAETATTAILSLFSLMLIARAIGPQAAGTGAVAIAAFLLADLACASLFSDSLVQRLALSERHARSATTAQVVAGLLGAVLLSLLAPSLARTVEAPEVQPLTLALAWLLPFSAFSGAMAGLVLRRHRYRLLASRALLGQPLGLAAGLLAAHAGWGPWAMAAQQAGNTLVTFLLMLGFGRQRLRPRFSGRAIADLWPVAGPQIVSVVVMAGRYRLFVLALGVIAAEAVVAVCNVGFRVLDSALGVVWGTISRLALPRFCALQNDPEGLADAYGDIAQLQALMGMPIAAGVALTAPDMVLALLGPAWAEAAQATRVVASVAVLSFAWGEAGCLFIALGKTRRNLGLSVASLAVPLGALLLLRPGTPVGVAACWAAGTVAVAPWIIWLVLRELRRPFRWLLGRIAPALAATALMSLAVLLLRAQWQAPRPLVGLLAFARTGAFTARAARMGGYDTAAMGAVAFNL